MTTNSFMDCERKNLDKLKKLQLPNHYKKLGIAIVLISLAALLLNKFIFEIEQLRPAAKYGMLIGMLLISISKEKIEDELAAQLRMQSYSFAFIAAVAYTLALPLIAFLIDWVIKTKEANVKDIGDFTILWMLLFIQVFYFEMLKRMHK
jgi:hypothetical protein